MDRHLGAEHLEQVPGDGFTLAVLVGCEQELICVFQRPFEFGDGRLLRLMNHVVRLELVVDIDGVLGPGLLAVGFG